MIYWIELPIGITFHEWIKKITLMDDVYVLNNMGHSKCGKHTSHCAMMRLGFAYLKPDDSTKEYPKKRFTNDSEPIINCFFEYGWKI